jgi:hypothetical protein
MNIFEIPGAYKKDSIQFFKSPRLFLKDLNFEATEEARCSVEYLGFAFLLSSAFVLVELKLIPEELTGPAAASVQKDELIFSYWVSTIVFVLLSHAACRLLSGQGRLRTDLTGLCRVYSFLIPATTLVLIVLGWSIGAVLSTYLVVTPPLGVLLLEPFEPSTNHLLLLAGFLTVYFYLALFFVLCTVGTLHKTHRFTYGRTLVATSSSVVALGLIQPVLTFCVRRFFDIFEPLIKVFL